MLDQKPVVTHDLVWKELEKLLLIWPKSDLKRVRYEFFKKIRNRIAASARASVSQRGDAGNSRRETLMAPTLAFSSARALARGNKKMTKNCIKTPNLNSYNSGCRTRIKAILDALESL